MEATLVMGGHGVVPTGQLGDVMREIAERRIPMCGSQCRQLGINAELFRTAGGTSRAGGSGAEGWTECGRGDGDGVGVGLCGCAGADDTAMTGEITLSGLVLPIGGVKEKVLAARRAGIQRVILPHGNERDLQELPEEVREEMEFILAERIEDALTAAVPESGAAVSAGGRRRGNWRLGPDKFQAKGGRAAHAAFQRKAIFPGYRAGGFAPVRPCGC